MDTSKDGMIEYLRKQLAEKDVGLDAATQIINQHVADLDTLTQQLADCEAAADLIAQRNAELEEDNQRKKDHIKHFRKQLAESQAQVTDLAEMFSRCAQKRIEDEARDAVRIEALEIASDFLADRMHTAPINRIDRALAMPSDSTALDEAIRRAVEDERQKWPEVSHSEAIRQAKREALLEAAEVLEQGHPHITRVGVSVALRRMAEELERE